MLIFKNGRTNGPKDLKKVIFFYSVGTVGGNFWKSLEKLLTTISAYLLKSI